MNISTTDAQGLFTKKLIDVYAERTTPTNFLKSFFKTTPSDITDTLEVSIEVERDDEKIAVDVERGTDGNRNEWTRSVEKIWIPPYFREYFDQTILQAYERAFRASEISDAAFSRLLNSTADHVVGLQNKIERTHELYCSQVLETGVMVLHTGNGQIDFKRKAGSMVDLNGAGGYWATNNDLFAQFQAGAVWLRKFGKVATNQFIAVLGSEAATDLYKNTTFLSRQNLFNMKLDNFAPPEMKTSGGVYLGTLTAGPYKVDIWTYDQYYKNAAGTLVPYVNPKKGFMIPMNPRFKFAYGMTPQLLEPGQEPVTGKFIINEFVDEKKRTREFHVESAGMPVPVAIDTIYTFKAVAG